MSDIKVVSIDFWETLFFDKGNSSYRAKICSNALEGRLKNLGLKNNLDISKTFYETVDKYVRARWANNVSPTIDDVIQYVFKCYGRRVSREVCEDLLKTVYELYTDRLRPTLARNGKRIVKWLSQRWPLYIVSDTYVLVGKVLDVILAKEGMVDLFEGRFYSDQLQRQKPDPTSIQKIAELEGVSPYEIVHIGDQLKTDGELAWRAGCHCIIVNREVLASPYSNFDSNRRLPIGKCGNLDEIKNMLPDKTSRESTNLC